LPGPGAGFGDIGVEFSPPALLEEFDIEVLCSKNPATANLSIYSEAEEQLGKKLWPTFHPDNLFRLRNPGWEDDDDVQLLDAPG